MKINFELKSFDNLAIRDESDYLVKLLNNSMQFKDTGTKISLPGKKIGTFNSLDPSIINLIINIVNVGAIGIILKGIFDIIIQWLKNKAQKITIKVENVSIDVPANASEKKIKQLVKKVKNLLINKSIITPINNMEVNK